MLVLCLYGIFETFLFPSNPSLHRQFNPAYFLEQKWQVFVGAEERFGLPELRTWAVNARVDYYHLGMRSFGSDIYRENSLELGYGFPIVQSFSAGLTTTVLNSWIKDHDNEVTYSVKLGGIFTTAKADVGLWIGNINMPRFSETDCLPFTYSVHTFFSAAQQFNFYFAVMGMNTDLPFFDLGMIFLPTEGLRASAGLNTDNFLFEYGLALALGKFTLNYSGNSHRQLGLSHEFSLMFSK